MSAGCSCWSLGPSARGPTAVNSCSLAAERRGDCVRSSWLYSQSNASIATCTYVRILYCCSTRLCSDFYRCSQHTVYSSSLVLFCGCTYAPRLCSWCDFVANDTGMGIPQLVILPFPLRTGTAVHVLFCLFTSIETPFVGKR